MNSKSMTALAIFTTILILSSCSSSGHKVIDRADGHKGKPEWAMLTADMKESGGKIWIADSSSMAAQDNRQACLKSAVLRARTGLAEQLQIKIESLAHSYLSSGSDEFGQTVTASVSQSISGSKIEAQYWEVEQNRMENHVDEKMHCYARISLDGEVYRKLLKNIIDATTNNEIKRTMEDEVKRFITEEKMN